MTTFSKKGICHQMQHKRVNIAMAGKKQQTKSLLPGHRLDTDHLLAGLHMTKHEREDREKRPTIMTCAWDSSMAFTCSFALLPWIFCTVPSGALTTMPA